MARLGVALFACARPPATVVPADSEITLAPGERAQLAGTDFGDARVAFRARGAGSDTTVVLSTADTTSPAAIGPYRLELQALAPFKQQEAAIPVAAYRATIRVSRSE